MTFPRMYAPWRAYLILVVAGSVSLGSLGCPGGVGSRTRAPGVPDAAAWVRATEGGVWILCTRKLPAEDRFACAVHDENTGAPIVSSEFLLRRAVDGDGERTFESVSVPPTLRFRFWDGDRILLRGSLLLLPVHRFHDVVPDADPGF